MRIGRPIAIAALLIGITIAACVAWWLETGHDNKTNGSPLTQEAYVWQRAWTPGVRQAVQEHGPAFSGLVFLGAEISFTSGRPHVKHTDADYALMAQQKRPVGLALRISAYSGRFAADGEPVDTIVSVAAGLVQQALRNGLNVRELQIDFDCPDSKLAGYATWAAAIRKAVAPTPVVITALPSWLNQPDIAKLLNRADGFILQVHSLRRPGNADNLPPLCDPKEASLAVERAGKLSRPFRVALPTYSYRIAFSAKGRYLGIAAESPGVPWPADAVVRELRAEPSQMAMLVSQWARAHPANMQGIIWYRLPTSDDTMNWHWRTLQAVMAGQSPAAALSAEIQVAKDGVADVVVVNTGSEDADMDVVVNVDWADGQLIAADALAGFEKRPSQTANQLEFAGKLRLRPAQRKTIGWIRLSENREVHAHVQTGIGE